MKQDTAVIDAAGAVDVLHPDGSPQAHPGLRSRAAVPVLDPAITFGVEQLDRHRATSELVGPGVEQHE